MLAEVQIVTTKSDIEDCHRLGKNGSTMVRFVNRKLCNDILGKEIDLHKNIDKSKLGFVNDTKIYVSESLTPYSQQFTRYGVWKVLSKLASTLH